MRFTLRTLFISITLVAVGLMCWLGYRQATLCRLQWLTPSSPAAKSLFPTTTIDRHLGPHNEESYRFTYYARSHDIQSLYRALPLEGEHSIRIGTQSITVESRDQGAMRVWLTALQTADQPQSASFVIRGKVVDRHGKPVPRATIDLLGGYIFINHFQTRDDGTFTMPLSDAGGLAAPARSGYYLQVRDEKDSAKTPIRWNTPSFTLSPTTPESDVLIVLPQAL